MLLLTDVSVLRLLQRILVKGSDVPVMSRGAKSLQHISKIHTLSSALHHNMTCISIITEQGWELYLSTMAIFKGKQILGQKYSLNYCLRYQCVHHHRLWLLSHLRLLDKFWNLYQSFCPQLILTSPKRCFNYYKCLSFQFSSPLEPPQAKKNYYLNSGSYRNKLFIVMPEILG